MKRFAFCCVVLFVFASPILATQHPTPVNGVGPRAELAAMPFGVPEIEACEGILTQPMLDHVNASKVDPAAAYRQEHPYAFHTPRPVRCESKIWQALKAREGDGPLK